MSRSTVRRALRQRLIYRDRLLGVAEVPAPRATPRVACRIAPLPVHIGGQLRVSIGEADVPAGRVLSFRVHVRPVVLHKLEVGGGANRGYAEGLVGGDAVRG